jgi:hypothetical protein
MDPAQAVLADIELTGIVADNHGVGQEAMRLDAAAQILMREHERYNDAIASIISDTADTTVSFHSEVPAARFAPGLIVDFPAFRIERRGVMIATGRLCATVCLHESRSKVWMRISSVNDEAWGDTSLQQLQNLVGQARHWFSSSVADLVTLYQSHLEEALAQRGRPASINFSVRKKIEIISGDTPLKGLSSLTTAITNREDVHRQIPSSQAARRLDAFARCVPGMGLGVDHQDSVIAILQSDAPSLGGHYYLVPHRTAQGFRGVYIVHEYAEGLLFAGIASVDPDPLVLVRHLGQQRIEPNSPSKHVTAELANIVARYF